MSSAFLTYISELMTTKHYAKRTIKCYLYWIEFFILFLHKRHPNEMGDSEGEALSRSETQNLLLNMHPKHMLIAQLLYGSGLRLMEA